MLCASDEDEDEDAEPQGVKPTTQVCVQVGGGKRRGGRVAGGGDREDRVGEMADELWDFRQKYVSITDNKYGEAMTDCGKVVEKVWQFSQTSPQKICEHHIKLMSEDDANKMLKDFATMKSNKPELRIDLMSKTFFKDNLRQLRELSKKINEGIRMTYVATELILLSQVADDGGNISWRTVASLLTKRIGKTRPMSSTNRATNTDDDDGDIDMGSNDDDDDNDDELVPDMANMAIKRKPGRPKKVNTSS